MKIKILFLFFVCQLLLGCASMYVPPVELASIPKEGKVALIVSVSDKPKHTHVGTTIFNNFKKEYDYNWEMEQYIVNSFSREIEEKTNLEVERVSTEFLADFVDVQNKQWTFNSETEELRNKLREQNFVAVVSIVEGPTLASLECSQFGCAEHYSAGYGLFTRSIFGLDRYVGSASFYIKAEIISSPVDLTRIGELSEVLAFDKKNATIEDFEDPKNFEELTEDEMLAVKKHINDYLSQVANKVGLYLTGQFIEQGVVKGSNRRQR